jgi:flagellar basal body P-ring formation protein FlgA
MRSRILATVLGALCALALASGGAEAQRVDLKPRIEARGDAVTLGDIFENAGAAGGRAVAPAPAIGSRATFSARFIAAAAQAAGLEWTPPAGFETITVIRTGAARLQRATYTVAAPVIKRGDLVTLVYVAPGLQLTTRAKAAGDAALGQPVKLINLQSNKTVEAIATGAGSASANGPLSF